MKIDGFDQAIVGMCTCWDGDKRVERVIYDGPSMVGYLIADGMSADEAYEYIDKNIEGAYIGPETPIIMWCYDDNNS